MNDTEPDHLAVNAAYLLDHATPPVEHRVMGLPTSPTAAETRTGQ